MDLSGKKLTPVFKVAAGIGVATGAVVTAGVCWQGADCAIAGVMGAAAGLCSYAVSDQIAQRIQRHKTL